MTNQITPIKNSPQEKLIKSKIREVGYGGQAGGGKSYALLLDALYQLPKPGYDAIMFRRTYKQLREAGGLIDLSQDIYRHLGGVYNQSNYVWTFPKFHNNTIRFSHLEHEKNVQDFSGSQYPWIGFDELQNFTERQYLFLFSRNRSSNPEIDLYIRSTFNPGGIGHYWIKKRFIDTNVLTPKWYKRVDGKEIETTRDDSDGIGRLFIPSRLEDNPYLWRDGDSEYERGLSQMDAVDYRRIRLGDWDIRRTGRVYYAFNQPGPASYELPLDKVQGYYHSHDFGAVNHVFGLWAKIDDAYYLVYSEKLPEGTTPQRAERIKRQFIKTLNNKIEAYMQEMKNDKDFSLKNAQDLAIKNWIITGYGGAKSETQIRADYRAAGVNILTPPISDVESQIRLANDMLEKGTMVICSDQLEVIDQLDNCVRDDNEGIQDKSTFHWTDMLRYFAAGISRGGWAR